MTASQVRSATYPAAPVPEPIEGSLLNIVTPGGLGEYLYGQGLFDSYNCLVTGTRTANNCGPSGTLGTDSKFEDAPSPQWMDGLRFTAYGTTVCKLSDPAEQKSGTERAYTVAESRVIEAALMSDVFVASAGGDPDFPGVWDAAEDLTPAAATTGVEATKGLGILESHLAANYAGKGIIHMPRLVATLLLRLGALHMEGGVLYTGLGTPVAAGAGYDYPNTGPDGNEAAEDTKWIYATGLVIIERQRLDTHDAFNIYNQSAVPLDPNYIPGLQPNDNVILTEGTYVVAVDCYKSAINVAV
jgi:hypothetical protein